MKPWILAPLGRAEPDDIQGWLEHGGGLGLQVAWLLSPDALRTRLHGMERRDGRGTVAAVATSPAVITVDMTNPSHALLASELPAFILEGALVWARACEQSVVTVVMERDAVVWHLWQEVLAHLTRWGVIGQKGWTQTEIHLMPSDPAATANTLDALTARLLPAMLWERRDVPVTLLKTAGRFARHTIHEIPLGLSIRDFVFQWAGGIPTDGVLMLGATQLEKRDWNLPLTYAQWGDDLGTGVLTCQ